MDATEERLAIVRRARSLVTNTGMSWSRALMLAGDLEEVVAVVVGRQLWSRESPHIRNSTRV